MNKYGEKWHKINWKITLHRPTVGSMQSKHAPCHVVGRYLPPPISRNSIPPAISHRWQVKPEHAIVKMVGGVPSTSVPFQNKVISSILVIMAAKF